MLRKILISLIRGYQVAISPYLGRWCRFEPSCSAYALQALESHGLFRGSFLAVCRIGRCHPFCQGGFDPVPACQHTTPGCVPKGTRAHVEPHHTASLRTPEESRSHG